MIAFRCFDKFFTGLMCVLFHNNEFGLAVDIQFAKTYDQARQTVEAFTQRAANE